MIDDLGLKKAYLIHIMRVGQRLGKEFGRDERAKELDRIIEEEKMRLGQPIPIIEDISIFHSDLEDAASKLIDEKSEMAEQYALISILFFKDVMADKQGGRIWAYILDLIKAARRKKFH